jgi:hypothetical protein
METDEPEDKKDVETDGSVVATYEVERGPQSSIHTNLSLLSLNVSLLDEYYCSGFLVSCSILHDIWCIGNEVFSSLIVHFTLPGERDERG